MTPEGFGEYRLMLLQRLDRLDESHDDLRERLDHALREIVALKARASVWGAIAGAVPAVLVLAWECYHRA